MHHDGWGTQLVAALALVGTAISIAMAQVGGPPIAPACTCLNSQCAGAKITAYDCSCCLNGTTGGWSCQDCNGPVGDCFNPTAPFIGCVAGLQ